MRKFAVFSATIFACILLAGLYGILHDQVTFSIAPEYFTKFKYQQFGIDSDAAGSHRKAVSLIGFLATWWTGIFIGIGLGATGFIFKDHKAMRKAIQKAVGCTFCIALLFAVLGFIYGRFVLTKTGVDWWMPDDLIDRSAFITVGCIHNFSYLGGLVGLIAGIFLLIRVKRKQNAAMLVTS